MLSLMSRTKRVEMAWMDESSWAIAIARLSTTTRRRRRTGGGASRGKIMGATVSVGLPTAAPGVFWVGVEVAEAWAVGCGVVVVGVTTGCCGFGVATGCCGFGASVGVVFGAVSCAKSLSPNKEQQASRIV